MDEDFFFALLCHEMIWGKTVRKKVLGAESVIRIISIYQPF